MPAFGKTQFTILLVSATILLGGCGSDEPLPTEQIDLEKYMGTWYEIARLPNSFEKGLKCVTATYELKDNGKVNVLNRGHKISDPTKVKDANGTAWLPDPATTGQLKVRFFWPFAGDYYIIRIDEGYEHVLVGDPSRKYLWILSRTPSPDQATVESYLKAARQQGFDVESMEWIEHDCS